MKYEFQVRMQQRHLKAIVGALRFRQRLLAGDVYGTIGCGIWQRKRCHLDRGAAICASAAIRTWERPFALALPSGQGSGHLRKCCHQGGQALPSGHWCKRLHRN